MKRDLRLLVASFPLIVLMVAAGHYLYDRPLTAFCAGLNNQVMTFFQMVTYLGVSVWYLVGAGILFLYFYYGSRNRIQATRLLYLFCAIAVSGLITDGIKWLMGRWRPKVLFAEGFYGFNYFGIGYEQTSFPSGHATTICSAALVLSLLYPRLRWLWIVIALLVCLSRVAIGAHYLSDVLMGAYIGFFVSYLLRNWSLFGKTSKGGYWLET